MIAEIFLRQREEKGRKEALQDLAARLEPMTTQQRLAEIARLIRQARKTGPE